MANSTPSRVPLLVIGAAVAGALVGRFSDGTVFRAGPSVVDPAQYQAVASCYGSGCVVTQECETGVTRTGCTATQSGGLATSNTCVIANPFNGTATPVTSTGYVTDVQVDMFTNPTATRLDIGVVSSTTLSGQTIANSILLATGATTLRATGGATSGGVLVPVGGSLKVTATSAVTSSTRLLCRGTFIPVRRN